MDQWRSHIPRNNLPKQFCERCFEQGDRKSQQRGLELVLELVFRVCGRKKKRMGAGISGGGPPWAHEAGGAPSTLVARWLAPLVCSLFHKSSNILEKIIFNFQGIWRTFIFGVFLYCKDNQITDRKLFIFILFQLNNRKYREGIEGCASSFIHLMLIKRNPLTRLIKSC